MKTPARQAGFTLVELLVAGTLMVVILSALGSLFVSTNRAYRVNDAVSEQQQSADAAAQLLSYEIGLAGYRGSEYSTTSLLPSFSGSTFTITKGATPETSDKIAVQYYEDRFTKGFVSVIFEADKVDGIYNLYRTTGTKQPAIENVRNLKVLRYIKKNGSEAASVIAAELAALKLELTFVDKSNKTSTKQVIVGINNTQQDPVLPNL